MSLKYRNSQGVETPVAGLNGQNGSLVPSVALKQSGTGNTDTISVGGYANKEITFTTPMPDTDYVINFDSNLAGGILFTVMSKTVSSFVVNIYNMNNIKLAVTFNWQAFKLMTDTVHQADSAHIAQNTANFAPAFSEVTSYAVGDYVTYNNVLYRCTTAHTAGTWVAGHFTAVTVGGQLKDVENTTKRIITSFDMFTDLGLTAGTTYTLLQLWQMIYNKYGRCFFKGSTTWSGVNAWTLSDGSNIITVNNGTFDLDVEVYNLWHTLKGTVHVNDGAGNGAFYVVDADIADNFSTAIYQKIKHIG